MVCHKTPALTWRWSFKNSNWSFSLQTSLCHGEQVHSQFIKHVSSAAGHIHRTALMWHSSQLVFWGAVLHVGLNAEYGTQKNSLQQNPLSAWTWWSILKEVQCHSSPRALQKRWVQPGKKGTTQGWFHMKYNQLAITSYLRCYIWQPL